MLVLIVNILQKAKELEAAKKRDKDVLRELFVENIKKVLKRNKYRKILEAFHAEMEVKREQERQENERRFKFCNDNESLLYRLVYMLVDLDLDLFYVKGFPDKVARDLELGGSGAEEAARHVGLQSGGCGGGAGQRRRGSDPARQPQHRPQHLGRGGLQQL